MRVYNLISTKANWPVTVIKKYKLIFSWNIKTKKINKQFISVENVIDKKEWEIKLKW